MTRPLRFGLQFDFRNPPQWERPWGDFYREMIDFAAWTETVGYDDVWMSEHHAAEDGYLPSPLIAATAIAGKTKKARIGTAIAIGPLYHPVRLAEDCAVLDIISDGRVELGIGLGYRADEFAGYGLRLEGRGTRVDEMLQIVRRLWDGETVTFKGQHFDISGARIMPRPLQAHPPLWVGGFNDAAIRRAARFGDGLISAPHVAVSRHGDYAQALRAAGRDPAAGRIICSLQWLIVSEDPEKTVDEVAPHVLHQVNTYAQWLKSTTHQLYAPMDLATFKTSKTLQVMTPDEAIALISGFAAAAPVEGFYGMIPPAGFPLDRLAEHVELFARKVIPAVNARPRFAVA